MEECRRLIESRLDWGPPEGWSTSDFEELSELILADTGKSVGASTLKRVWGRVKYDSRPSQHTLNTLAGYVGAKSWRAFKREVDAGLGHPPPAANFGAGGENPQGSVSRPPTGSFSEALPLPVRPEAGRPRLRSMRLWASVLGFILIVTAGISVLYGGNPVLADSTPANVRFSSRPVATGIPNSVVFTYELAGVSADSFFIQQSWDPRLRDRIEKTDREFTSIYFYPGHFWAKLVANDTVLREHPLVVPSGGWLGLIERPGPQPIYVPLESSPTAGLQIAPSWLSVSDLPLRKAEATMSLYHVGEFPSFSDRTFELSSQMRLETEAGHGACHQSRVVLIGQDGRIDVPFSIPGCSAELDIVAGETQISGRTNDLSGLGTDLSAWRRIVISGADGLVSIGIDGAESFHFSYEESIGNIVGLRYRFRGIGSIKDVRLSSGEVTIFEEL